MDACNRTTTKPLTGEPDAGEPPVRFGGRGEVNPSFLPLSRIKHVRPQYYLNRYSSVRVRPRAPAFACPPWPGEPIQKQDRGVISCISPCEGDGPGANPGFLTNENGPVRFAFASFLQLESNLLRTFHFSKTRKESHERRNYCLYRHMYCSRSTLDLAPHSVARSGEERGQHTFTRNAGRFCAA